MKSFWKKLSSAKTSNKRLLWYQPNPSVAFPAISLGRKRKALGIGVEQELVLIRVDYEKDLPCKLVWANQDEIFKRYTEKEAMKLMYLLE